MVRKGREKMPRKNRRSAQTEQQICRIFLELLEKKPLSKMSVTEICRIADLDRSTFYLHFCDVYELMRYLERVQLADIREQMQELSAQNLPGEAVVRAILRYLGEHRSTFLVLMREGSPAFWNEIRRLLQQAFRDAVCRQYPEAADLPEQELESTIVFLTNGYYGIYRRWLQDHPEEELDSIAQLSTQLSTACIQSRLLRENGRGEERER